MLNSGKALGYRYACVIINIAVCRCKSGHVVFEIVRSRKLYIIGRHNKLSLAAVHAIDHAACAVNAVLGLNSAAEIRYVGLCFFGVVWCKFVLVVKNKSVVFVLIRKYRAFGIDIILIILMLIKMVRRYVRYHGDIGLTDHAVQLE